MNNEDNIYFTLAQQIRNNINNNTVQTVNLGKVISVSPLLISCNGIQLDREDLYINKDLLIGTIENFKVNDTVVLLTSDNQKFILLSVVI